MPGGTVDETPDRAGVGLGADGALMPPVLGVLATPVSLPLAEKVTPPLTTGLGAGFGAGLGADLAIAYSLPVVLIEGCGFSFHQRPLLLNLLNGDNRSCRDACEIAASADVTCAARYFHLDFVSRC